MRRAIVFAFVALLLIPSLASARHRHHRHRGNQHGSQAAQASSEGSPRVMARLERVERELALASPVPYWQYKRAVADAIHGTESEVETGRPPTASPEPQFAYCLPNRYPFPDLGLCLEGRFIVVATWDNPFDAAGTYVALGVHMTSVSGYFFFLGPGNPEVVIKEINGCFSGNPSHWIFASGMTNYTVDIGIKDLATGVTIYYHNNGGSNFNTIIDQHTPFPCP